MTANIPNTTGNEVANSASPEINPSGSQQHQGILNRKTLWLAIATLAIIVLTPLAVVWTHSLHPSSSKPYPYRYKVDQLNSFNLFGFEGGGGISFAYPAEFHLISSLPYGAQGFTKIKTADFYQAPPASSSQNSSLGAMSVGIVPFSNIDPNQHSAARNISGSASNAVYYQDYINHIKSFITTGLGGDYKLNLDSPTKFTNPTVSSDAWRFNFTIKGHNQSYEGTQLYIIGQKADYYFNVETVNYNWKPNQTTFEAVLNSVKINQ